MFGVFKNVFWLEEGKGVTKREHFFSLTSHLEDRVLATTQHLGADIIDIASKLRNMLKENELALSRAEKIRLIKALNKAKVKAFLGGTGDYYRVFRSLDSISSDVLRLI